MKVLVVYNAIPGKPVRKNCMESIQCYKKYCGKGNFVYNYNYDENIGSHRAGKLSFLKKIPFDAVIFHFTFLALRWHPDEVWELALNNFSDAWPGAVKVIVPQDENYSTGRIREFSNQVSADIILSLASGKNKRILYPADKVNAKKIYTILTSYVDEDTHSLIQRIYRNDIGHRRYDIGYRARDVEYSIGRHGQLKTQIVEQMKKRAQVNGLRENIRNTTDTKNVFFGDDWFKFMLDCDTMPGCLGGGSIMDIDDSLRQNVNAYRQRHRKADFEEVFELFLKDYEGNIDYTAISPRNFESVMTKTCQILVEADYKFLQPGVHYINLSKDFSNVDEVIEMIQDKEYCRQIAENAYRDVILSKKYTYKRYVNSTFHVLRKFNHEKTAYGENKCVE